MNHISKTIIAATLLTVTLTATFAYAKLTVTSVKPSDKKPAVAETAKTWPTYGNVFYRNKKGAFFRDPVCEMYGVVGDKTPTSIIAGKTYCFDSDACKKKFDKATEKFIASSILPTRVVSVDGQQVTVIDAVNNKQVALKKETPFRNHMSKRYFFSSDSTAKAFEKNPAQYSVNSKLKDKTPSKTPSSTPPKTAPQTPPKGK